MATLEERAYRPPPEADSALLEIALGCSYGRCSFCRYAADKIPLQLMSPQMIGDNLEELSASGENARRMFFLGGNVLAFKTRYLIDMFGYVKSYLPQVEEFSMYARADDVERKTDDQLSSLRDAGLAAVYIGVESGNAHVLEICNKGLTPQRTEAALHRLDRIGIGYGLSSILGLGGTALWREHARDTAALYNRVHPSSIRVMTLTPFEGTPLAADIASGTFTLMAPRQILEEEKLLLENMDGVKDCRFFGNHTSNMVPVQGNLPTDRERMISRIDAALADWDDSIPPKPQSVWW